MLRLVTAILLCLSFAIQSFKGSFIVLNYHYNKTSFLQNCVNKARPQLNCNGQCVLMKKLKEAEQKEQQTPERKLEIKTDWISSKSFFALLVYPTIPVSVSYNSGLTNPPLQGFQDAIFHPPSCA